MKTIMAAIALVVLLSYSAEGSTGPGPVTAMDILKSGGEWVKALGPSGLLLGAVWFLGRRLEKRDTEHTEQENAQRADFLSALNSMEEAREAHDAEARKDYLASLERITDSHNKATLEVSDKAHREHMEVLTILGRNNSHG